MMMLKKMSLSLSFLLVLAISGPLFSQVGPSQLKYLPEAEQCFSVLGKHFFKSPGLKINSGNFKQFSLKKFQIKSWKIAPPPVHWKAASRWRSIQEIYILKHRVYNELILNKKRLNLA